MVTRRGMDEKKTANSLRISDLLWCHQHCLYLCSCVAISHIHSMLRWIISFAPLISYGILGISHRTFLALIPLADSQRSLYDAKLAIILCNHNIVIVNTNLIQNFANITILYLHIIKMVNHYHYSDSDIFVLSWQMFHST